MTLGLTASTLIAIDFEMAGAHCRTPVLEGLRVQDVTDFHWAPLKEKYVVDAELSLFKKFRSPTLRELHLDGVMVPHDCIPFASLSRLSLQLVGTEIVAKEYLVGVLKGGSSLVSLSLDIWRVVVGLGHDEWTTSTADNLVPLPQLRQLTLKGPIDQCSIVHRLLSAPSLEEIKLEIRYFGSTVL